MAQFPFQGEPYPISLLATAIGNLASLDGNAEETKWIFTRGQIMLVLRGASFELPDLSQFQFVDFSEKHSKRSWSCK